jgi:hypothetical protein
MAKRPLTIVLASLLLLYFPAELMARRAAGFPSSFGEIFISAVLPFVVLIGLLRVSKTAWYSLVAFVALWGLHDLYLFYMWRGGSVAPLFAHLVIYALSLGYFINPRIRTLYFDPKLCWWKSKPRFETHLPLIVREGEKWNYPVLKNVSEGGCFIETPHPAAMGSSVEISIPLPVPLQVSVIHTSAEVRWVSRNPLRSGMGVEFFQTAPIHRKAIRQYVRDRL